MKSLMIWIKMTTGEDLINWFSVIAIYSNKATPVIEGPQSKGRKFVLTGDLILTERFTVILYILIKYIDVFFDIHNIVTSLTFMVRLNTCL